MRTKSKVMILHNIISPYRLPLFEELSKKYDLTVYFCKENDKERKWSTKLDGYSFKYKILPYKDIGPFVINPTLKKELKENAYDIYILVENPENAFSILKIIKLANKNKKKMVLWNERIDNEIYTLKNLKESINIFKKLFYSFSKLIYKRYRKLIYKRSDGFISFSKISTEFLISNKIDKSKIFETKQIMPKSLLLKPTWREKPKEFKDKKIIFYLGYLNERKGVDYLIKAFNNLNRKDTLLLIAGSGDQENKLKELAKDSPNIKFLGYIGGVKRANYYSIANFFVFPSLYDVWGLVVNESLYYGLPVISTNKAGAIGLIGEGKTGFIVSDKNVDALEDAMRKLLDNPQLLKKMKENVKKIPKSRIVDINTSIKTFEKAINYSLNQLNINSNNKK